jgi:hypothetical protein
VTTLQFLAYYGVIVVLIVGALTCTLVAKKAEPDRQDESDDDWLYGDERERLSELEDQP